MADFDSSITAHFGGDVSGLEKAVGQASTLIGSFQSAMNKIGIGVGAAAVIGFFKEVVGKAGQIQDLADSLGVSTDAVQAFSHAVRLAGGDTADVGTVMRALRNQTDLLAEGNTKAVETFQKLGISQKDLIGLPLETKLEKVSAGYLANKESAGAYGALVDIVGTRSVKLIGVLEQLGTDGFGALEAGARSAGQLIESETIARLDTLGDRLEEAKTRMVGWGAKTLDVVNKIAMGWGAMAAASLNGWQMIATVPVNMEETAKKAVVAIDKVSSGLVGQMATVKELAAFNAAESKREVERLEMAGDRYGKINELLERAKHHAAESAKYTKGTREELDEIGKANQALLEYEKELAKWRRESVQEYAKENEYARLVLKNEDGISEAANLRVQRHRLINQELGVERDLKNMLRDGFDALSATDRERVRTLQTQQEELKKQIALKSALIQSAHVQESAEARVTREFEEQKDLTEHTTKMTLAKQNADLAAEEAAITSRTGQVTKDQKAAIARNDIDEAIKLGGELMKLKEQYEATQAKRNDYEGAYYSLLIGKVRGAAEFGRASEEVLEEVIRRNEAKIAAIKKHIFENPTWGQNFHDRMEIANLQLDSAGAKKELDTRASVKNKPYDMALREYKGDPLGFDTFYRQVNEGYKKADITNDELKTISGILKNVFK